MRVHRSLGLVLALTIAGCGSSEEGDHAGHHEAAGHAEHAHHAHHAEHAAPEASAPALDGRSLHHLDADLALVDQHAAPFALASLEGRPTLVTFFYGGCTTMCPLIFSDVRRIVDALPEADRERVGVVLVTIDPVRDTPERLRALATERELPASWRLVSGDEGSIRVLAATLGMTYRALPDGSFAHAALYTVIDSQGRVVEQLDGVGRPIEGIVSSVRAQLDVDPS